MIGILGLGVGVGMARRGRGAGPSLAQLIARAGTQRIDFVGIGDSNQLQGSTGWDHGFQHALAQAYPMYATGLVSVNENNGASAGTGYGYARIGGAVPGAATGAPAALAAYLHKGAGGLAPADYGWIATGSAVTSPAGGIGLQNLNVLGHEGTIVFDLHHGSFAEAATVRPMVRRGESPWTILSHPPAASVNAGGLGMARTSLAIAADPARAAWPVEFRVLASGATQAGPFFGLYVRASNPGRSAGFAYHTLQGRGGQSLRMAAFDLQGASDTTLSYYFGEVRRLQGADKTVIVTISSGLNDRNETQVSVGPAAIAPGDGAAAFADNLEAIRLRLEAIWARNGWPPAELHLLVMVSHPVAQAEDAKLVDYRQAAAAWSAMQERCHHADLAALATHDEMLAHGWYGAGGADKNHLTREGYEALAARVIA